MWEWIPPCLCLTVFHLNIFAFSVFYIFFLQKNVHLKKSIFISSFFQVYLCLNFLQFLSSIIFPSDSPGQDEKDLIEIPKLDTGKTSVLPAYRETRMKSSVHYGGGRSMPVCNEHAAEVAPSRAVRTLGCVLSLPARPHSFQQPWPLQPPPGTLATKWLENKQVRNIRWKAFCK